MKREDLLKAIAPIPVEIPGHGEIRIRRTWSHEEHFEIKETLAKYERHREKAARAVIGILLVKEDSDSFRVNDILEEDFRLLLQQFLTHRRSLFDIEDGESLIDNFFLQCQREIHRTEDVMQSALEAFGRSVSLNAPKWAESITAQMEGIRAISNSLNRTTEMAMQFSTFYRTISSLDLTPLIRTISLPLPSFEALRRFQEQSARMWESLSEWVERQQLQIRKDRRLRTLGIDSERIRILGAYEWLSEFSLALDSLSSDEEAFQFASEHARSTTIQEMVEQLIETLPSEVRTVRRAAVREGLALHKEGRYISSSTVLVAQLDGLLGDVLEQVQKSEGLQPDRQTGMYKRIKTLDELLDPDNDFPSVLGSQSGIVTPPFGMESEANVKFTRTRNDIAHGDPKADYSEEFSTKQVFLILSLLLVYDGLTAPANRSDDVV